MSDPTTAQLRALAAIRDGSVRRIVAWSGTGSRIDTPMGVTPAVVERCIKRGWAEWKRAEVRQTHDCVLTRAGELVAPVIDIEREGR